MELLELKHARQLLREFSSERVFCFGIWALVLLLIASLMLDGFVFYRYGLVAVPPESGGQDVVQLNAGLLRDAARAVSERRTTRESLLFGSAPPLPSVFLPYVPSESGIRR